MPSLSCRTHYHKRIKDFENLGAGGGGEGNAAYIIASFTPESKIHTLDLTSISNVTL